MKIIVVLVVMTLAGVFVTFAFREMGVSVNSLLYYVALIATELYVGNRAAKILS